MTSDERVENFKGEYQSDKALPCPFCGEMPFLVPWHGGGPKKRNLMCQNEDCPVGPNICGDTETKAIAAWNTRAALAAAGPDVPGENGCASPREHSPWRPIETAPKGIRCLFFGNYPETGQIYRGKCTAEWMDGFGTATHWMPLPEAPFSDTRGEANPLSSCGEKP
jgi:hypothetical protein